MTERDDHDAAEYGRQAARDYDALYADIPDTAEAVSTLAELAGDGPVAEFGIGTGRLALPLAERGLVVRGIDGSEDMVARLHAKPGGEGIEVTVGDFETARVAGEHSLVVLAFNAIFALPSQDAQVRCLENAVAHLGEGGRVVVEAFIVDPALYRDGRVTAPRFADERRVELHVGRYDRAAQRLDRVLVHLTSDGVRLIAASDRYVSPAELDLMARIAGLRLRERWGGWTREPFTEHSAKHVSVYERAG